MPSVPNWIAKAVIIASSGSGDAVTPITEWRATKTQVIVRTRTDSSERRFYLDTLTQVGQPKYFREMRIRLEPPDSPAVLAAQRQAVIRNAQNSVSIEITRQRLQDTARSSEELAVKLTAIVDAANAALALLAEVL